MMSNLGYLKVGAVLGSMALGWVVLLALPALAVEAVIAAPQPLPIEGDIFVVVADDVDHDGRVDLIATNRGRETATINKKPHANLKRDPLLKCWAFMPMNSPVCPARNLAMF